MPNQASPLTIQPQSGNEFDLSHGFLPSQDPITQLPSAIETVQ